MKRWISKILTLIMMLTMFSGISMPVKAAGLPAFGRDDPNAEIQLNEKVKFAGRNWYVIGKNTDTEEGIVPSEAGSNTVVLLGEAYFSETGEAGCNRTRYSAGHNERFYYQSGYWWYLQYELELLYTNAERNAIISRNINDVEGTSSIDKLWVLSVDEIQKIDPDIACEVTSYGITGLRDSRDGSNANCAVARCENLYGKSNVDIQWRQIYYTAAGATINPVCIVDLDKVEQTENENARNQVPITFDSLYFAFAVGFSTDKECYNGEGSRTTGPFPWTKYAIRRGSDFKWTFNTADGRTLKDCNDGYVDDSTDEAPEESPVENKPQYGSVTSVTGASRVETAIQLADETKKLLGVDKYNTIIVADASNFPDGLTASYLSAAFKAPVLLTNRSKDTDVKAYIAKNLSDGGKVIIAGGVGVVPKAFEQGLNCVRLAGRDRYDTNIQILEYVMKDTPSSELIVASGKNFADALSVSATGRAVMIVGDRLSYDQENYIKKYGIKNVTIVGGTGAVSSDVETALKSMASVKRIGGSTRIETSKMIGDTYYPDSNTIIYTKADTFADGLSGSLLGSTLKAPIRLTFKEGDRSSCEKAYMLGGVK